MTPLSLPPSVCVHVCACVCCVCAVCVLCVLCMLCVRVLSICIVYGATPTTCLYVHVVDVQSVGAPLSEAVSVSFVHAGG